MQLRDALDDVKRVEGTDARFPGERRTTTGLFSGLTPDEDARAADARLVYVDRDGTTTDFSYPLTGLTGVSRARLGLRIDGESVWFDGCETTDQTYHEDTALVVTDHRIPDGDVTATQYDLTVGAAHLTHVTVDAPADASVELVGFYGFSPDGRDTQVAQLRHERSVELFHAAEHDYLTSATGFSSVTGQVPPSFAELLADDPVERPRGVDAGRYEEETLSGDVLCTAPVEAGAATLATLLTDADQVGRETALTRLDTLAEEFTEATALERAAHEQVTRSAPGPCPDAAAADLRVLSALSAGTGLRIAGPDFDPYYAHSGGYGYTWFRDDAEIALFCLEADQRFDLDLGAWHARSAAAYRTAQRADGSLPHRVWPRDGRLAPGWANGRLEAGDGTDYQADQTASVVTFLARALDAGVVDPATVEGTLDSALASLDETLAADGLPKSCQNAWEDATGRFAHTAATFLEAYSAAGALDGRPVAEERAEQVYDAVDDLWVGERSAYAYRLTGDGERDDRIDSASLALVAAHREYDRVHGVDDERLDRLVAHVGTVLDVLHRDPDESAVEGLVRYEGDPWRQDGQDAPKVWTVSTAWGANAAAHLAALLTDHDDPRAETVAVRARDLLALVLPDGPLSTSGGYLPEQFFDDGTPDSATPLGWPHALRLATVALLDERGLLAADPTVATLDD
ncbi:glycoside hydrolase family 15 protein [Halomarina oriensis]|uniref:Glucan 1,4-alpha-glucosidase n=1 Tax=Halomarina oriensis TaxID=671145 RepID=A0A6B0GN38_9EURY|nr:glycoside hydrolase family 15 protein [Halomarina oriensis]MWG36282.1 glucan 1,4-alpha-glucosidase [Halomarina oriensis]